MKAIIRRIRGLYGRFTCKDTNAIDYKIERIQQSVQAYNDAIDLIISRNDKLL